MPSSCTPLSRTGESINRWRWSDCIRSIKSSTVVGFPVNETGLYRPPACMLAVALYSIQPACFNDRQRIMFHACLVNPSKATCMTSTLVMM